MFSIFFFFGIVGLKGFLSFFFLVGFELAKVLGLGFLSVCASEQRQYVGITGIGLKRVTLDSPVGNDRRRRRCHRNPADDEEAELPQYAPSMADGAAHHLLLHRTAPPPPLSRVGMRHQATAEAVAAAGGCGEIVEVQGGHIVRSTGRKDRHSKVCTAKGPRDRRVRLSAHTAIQFYDVQDRLGFDRPSKAVDWLIKKAKTAIDELAELPPWNPAETLRHAAANAKPRRTAKNQSSPPSLPLPPPAPHEEPHRQFGVDIGGASAAASTVVGVAGAEHHMGEDNESGFLPPSLDSDSIADTMKSFFPVGGGSACASTEAPPQLMQSYHHPPPDLLSRTSSQNQDLRLSLQSFQDPPPLLLHHHHHAAAAAHQAEHVLFAGQNNPLGFDASTAAWEQSHHQQNHQSPEIGRIQRLVTWNSGGVADSGGGGGGGGGFVFASPSPTTTSFQPVFSQSQLFSQRGPLQSINTPMIRAWFDPHHHHHYHHHISATADDLHHHSYHIPPAAHQSAIPGIGFASQTGEFSGFRIPARIQGEEEEHGGIINKPSSASSISRH